MTNTAPDFLESSVASQTDNNPITRDLFEQVMTPNYSPMNMLPSHGKGSRLWDTDGKEYLDFAGGIAVSALGHCHPELISALVDQANKFWHVSNVIYIPFQPIIKPINIHCIKSKTSIAHIHLPNFCIFSSALVLAMAHRGNDYELIVTRPFAQRFSTKEIKAMK